MFTRKYLLGMACFSLLAVLSCTKYENKPLPGEALPPAPIKNVTVTNIPGGAVLSYSLPTDRSALYVEAQWKNQRGEAYGKKSSGYDNSLKLEGFADTAEHEIQLFAVNRLEEKSAPLTVKIKPLTSPIMTIASSLSVDADFGGCRISFENPLGANVMIGTIASDSTGEINTIYSHYTAQMIGQFNVRGMPSIEQTFGFYVRDQWDNYSDTIYATLTPLYEEFLDKSKFAVVELPGDLNGNYYEPWNNPVTFGWDNNPNTWFASWVTTSQLPNQSLTLDLGVDVKLSRFKIWQRQDYPAAIFGVSNLRKLEVWGRPDSPNGSGDWVGWTQLIVCNIIKPSGLPDGQLSNEDMEDFYAGNEFSPTSDIPAIRYVRLKFIETWGVTLYFNLGEISFWGALN